MRCAKRRDRAYGIQQPIRTVDTRSLFVDNTGVLTGTTTLGSRHD